MLPKKVRLGDWQQAISQAKEQTVVSVSELAFNTPRDDQNKTQNTRPKQNLIEDSRLFDLLQSEFLSIQRDIRVSDIEWWTSMSSGKSLTGTDFFIHGCCIHDERTIILKDASSENLMIWLSTDWIGEQFRLCRPMRLIHPRLHGLQSFAEVSEYLIYLLSNGDCQIRLFKPIRFDQVIIGRLFIIVQPTE